MKDSIQKLSVFWILGTSSLFTGRIHLRLHLDNSYVLKSPILREAEGRNITDLDDAQRRATEDSSRFVGILASAGSGKTRTLVARVVHAIRVEELKPREVVAFTFTERAANELRSRIFLELADLGTELSEMFIGTIHSFCYRYLLQDKRFINFEPLDEINTEALVYRLYDYLGLDKSHGMSFSKNVEKFLMDYELYENELLEMTDLPPEIRNVIARFVDILLNNRLLTFGSMIRYAVENLTSRAHESEIKHLLVDEFQDVNPAQLRLIKAMIGDSARLTVVGDDLQSIYQWRGSDVSLLLNFKDHFPGAKLHVLGTNYRSAYHIVELAEAFAKTIEPRHEKEMRAFSQKQPSRKVLFQEASDEGHQATLVGELIQKLRDQGYRWRDIAVLLRSARTSAPPILRTFRHLNIPFFSPQVSIDGTAITEVFVPLFKLLSTATEPRNEEEEVEQERLIQQLSTGVESFFQSSIDEISSFLEEWKSDVQMNRRKAYNVRLYLFELFKKLSIQLGGDEVDLLPQIGTLTQIIRSVEEIHRRNLKGFSRRPSVEAVYKEISYMLATRCDDFGETNMMMTSADAVIVTTVHQAKGLEWPIVIAPSVIAGRFPVRSRAHKTSFDNEVARRYGTSETDERRLFYVAITRAMDALYILGFKQRMRNVSKFVKDLHNTKQLETVHFTGIVGEDLPQPMERPIAKESFTIGLSDLLIYHECPFQYHLRRNSGIYPPIRDDLGFGRSLHEIIQRRAMEPDSVQLSALVQEYTHIPFESTRELEIHKQAIARRVQRLTSLGLLAGQTRGEVDIGIFIENVTIIGKIDCLVKNRNAGSFTILDWKSSIREEFSKRYSTQIQFYVLALRRSGVSVSNAYLVDIKRTYEENKPNLVEVNITPQVLKDLEKNLEQDLKRLREFVFTPKSSLRSCTGCDVNSICEFAKMGESR